MPESEELFAGLANSGEDVVIGDDNCTRTVVSCKEGGILDFRQDSCHAERLVQQIRDQTTQLKDNFEKGKKALFDCIGPILTI